MEDGHGPKYIAKALHNSESSTKKQMSWIRGGTCGLWWFVVVSGHPGAHAAKGSGGAGPVAMGVAGAVLGQKRSLTCLEAWFV